MNKHILLMYESEGRVSGIVEVSYEGTKEELIDVLDAIPKEEEIYLEDTGECIPNPDFDPDLVDIEDKLAHLGIEYHGIEYLVDNPSVDGLVMGGNEYE